MKPWFKGAVERMHSAVQRKTGSPTPMSSGIASPGLHVTLSADQLRQAIEAAAAGYHRAPHETAGASPIDIWRADQSRIEPEA